MFDLKKFRKDRKIGQKSIQEILNCTQGFISAVETGRKSLSESNVEKLFNAYGDLSVYLLPNNTDVGEATSDENIKFMLVPMYNFDAVGGVSNDEVDCKPYIIDHIAFQDAKDGDICMPVSGKSMLPTFAPGSIILLRQVHLWREYLELGQIYVLILKDGRRLLKEVRRSEEDKQKNYLLISHNSEFDPTEITKDFIVEVYLVKAMYQNLTM
ncbi:MAG: LexA family transcriptional regulator [Rikenellaceae bacterium]